MLSDKSTQQRKNDITPSEFPHPILIAEFSYARETAAQAMNDRHKMVNFFLIIVGVFANAIGVLLGLEKLDGVSNFLYLQRIGANILLFLIFYIGFLYLLKLIRLRKAWLESVFAMNKIKNYYDTRFSEFSLKMDAFRWTEKTLHPEDFKKLSSLFGLSAFLIISLNSFAIFGIVAAAMPVFRWTSASCAMLLILLLQILFYRAALAKERLPHEGSCT